MPEARDTTWSLAYDKTLSCILGLSNGSLFKAFTAQLSPHWWWLSPTGSHLSNAAPIVIDDIDENTSVGLIDEVENIHFSI